MQIYDLLKQDHAEVKELLRELINLKADDDYRFVLIEEIRNALISHSRAEESVFYNTIRAVDADKTIVAEGYAEHLEVETLLRTLQLKDRVNLDWKSTAKKLLETFEHHIGEEETKIFGEARKVFTMDESDAMGDAFQKLKPSFVGNSIMKNTADMVINMLPPRLVNSIRNMGSHGKV